MEERTFVDAHGVEIFTRWWMVDAPRAVVLVAHGASEHSGRYDRFARALNGAGFAAVAIDHRGHGRTGASGPRGVMGPGGGHAVIDDLHELRTAARVSVGDDVPVFLFGHSMGSLIALAYLTHHADGLAGSVLCGIPVNVDDAPAIGQLLESVADPAHATNRPTISSATTTLRSSRCGHRPIGSAATPTRSTASSPTRCAATATRSPSDTSWTSSTSSRPPAIASHPSRVPSSSSPAITIPLPRWEPHATTLAAALEAAGVPVSLTLYEGARHELLNETNRDQVTADIVGWFEAQL